MSIEFAKWVPWLPAAAAVFCGLCCTNRRMRTLAAPVCIVSLVSGFLITLGVKGQIGGELSDAGTRLQVFEWIRIGGLNADFAYYLDTLTVLMLLVVTGVGSLVAIYAAGYMAGDRGYARFFAAVSLFIFAMTTLVMADNLVLLYLGWEGVGLCSYLLIGYYYQKPSAVAAAKKAFIVNRIGDLGFALGIMLIYHQFGTVHFSTFTADGVVYPGLFEHCSRLTLAQVETPVLVIPFLLMLGAFGKSAQLPLYVWLPDAMEGPTPVSALIHAATMVTAGVYMIARLLPVFELSPYALPTVAVVGGATALFAATIALRQHDIKRVFAYSTVSQLGYMFLGVGVLSTVGGVFHLFTHAFFKALLFLTAGSVMHGLAGQLDMRKMSGLRTKMPVTCWLMFVGCLALAGFPFTAGFFSKDMILAAAMDRGLTGQGTMYTVLGIAGLFTALLTAYYTFRVWFRVFMGPTEYEMGEEHAAVEDTPTDGNEADPSADTSIDDGNIKVEHHHDAHEMGWLMNGPLVVLAVGALLAGWLGHADSSGHSWLLSVIEGSSANPTRMVEAAAGHAEAHTMLLGMELHTAMMVISSCLSVLGILVAAYLHWFNRPAADRLAEQWSGSARVLENKYFVDEAMDAVIVKPLRMMGYLCFVFDRLVIEGLVLAVGWVPRIGGLAVRRTQRGALQGYGIGMAVGVAVVAVLIAMVR